jgi:hypothetical protein
LVERLRSFGALNRKIIGGRGNSGERRRKTLRRSTPLRRERTAKQQLGEEGGPSDAGRSPQNFAGEGGPGDGRRRRSSGGEERWELEMAKMGEQ